MISRRLHHSISFVWTVTAALALLLMPQSSAFAEDIVEIAAKTPALSTLVTALKAANMARTLKGPGPYTVFAPTNAAFDKLPKAILAALLRPENRTKLVAILGYHVVPGGKLLVSEVTSDSVGTPSPPTLQGGSIMLTSIKPFLVNGVKVSQPDVNADNGVIHIVDSVLLPPGITLPGEGTAAVTPKPSTPVVPATQRPVTNPVVVTPDPVQVETPVATPATGATYKTLVELVTKEANLSILAAAIKLAKLDGALSGAGPFTLLAPTNDALNAVPRDVLTALAKPENSAKLAELLKYHVLPGRYTSADVNGLPQGSESPATLQGTPLTLTSISPLKVNNANVIKTDVLADNGVAHIIDAVLIPAGFVDRLMGKTPTTTPVIPDVKPTPPVITAPETPATPVPPTTATTTPLASSDQDIIEVATADPELSMFLKAVEATGLTSTLKRRGPFTVFAPNNAAFNKLKKKDLEELMSSEGAPKLSAIITYHIVVGQRRAADLSDGLMLKTANSEGQLKISVGSGVKAGNANVVRPDVPAKNGILHVVDEIIMPPANALPKPPPAFE